MGGWTVTINRLSTGRKRLGDDFLFFLSQSPPPYLVLGLKPFIWISLLIFCHSEICVTRTTSSTICCQTHIRSYIIQRCEALGRYQIWVKYSQMRNVRMRRDAPPTSQHDSGEVLSPKHRLWVETGEISSSVGLLSYLVIFQLSLTSLLLFSGEKWYLLQSEVNIC